MGCEYRNQDYLFVRDALNNITAITHRNKRIVARYKYDTWGNCTVYNEDGEIDTDPISIGNVNPFRWKSLYYDTESGLYYANGSYYDPTTGLYVDSAPIDGVIENGLSSNRLDRNSLMCNNVLELACNPSTIFNVIELYTDLTYDSDDGKFNWGKFWAGIGMVIAAITAIVIAASTFGAGIPISMQILAGVTIGAAALVGVNGVATTIEAGTNYNFMRDGLFGEVLQLDESAYNTYETVTDIVMSVGTMVLGVYHMTGQYKAAKYGQKFLGKGYKRVKGEKVRWISKDGLRQMIFDNTHHVLDGVKTTTHFNLYIHSTDMRIGKSDILKKLHLFYKLWKIWLR